MVFRRIVRAPAARAAGGIFGPDRFQHAEKLDRIGEAGEIARAHAAQAPSGGGVPISRTEEVQPSVPARQAWSTPMTMTLSPATGWCAPSSRINSMLPAMIV